MFHGAHLAAILDFVIRELRKLIISITFERRHRNTNETPIRMITFVIETFIMPQIEQNIIIVLSYIGVIRTPDRFIL